MIGTEAIWITLCRFNGSWCPQDAQIWRHIYVPSNQGCAPGQSIKLLWILVLLNTTQHYLIYSLLLLAPFAVRMHSNGLYNGTSRWYRSHWPNSYSWRSTWETASALPSHSWLQRRCSRCSRYHQTSRKLIQIVSSFFFSSLLVVYTFIFFSLRSIALS